MAQLPGSAPGRRIQNVHLYDREETGKSQLRVGNASVPRHWAWSARVNVRLCRVDAPGRSRTGTLGDTVRTNLAARSGEIDRRDFRAHSHQYPGYGYA